MSLRMFARPLRKKIFVVSAILFSFSLFVPYNLLQIMNSNEKQIIIDNISLNLPNVIVHLDLKGAPPKISYLKSLLPKLQDLGVTGLLIEYEDMFPFEGSLVNLSAKNAYQKSELQDLLKSAVLLGFDIIPLIQTFGHMEYVLKLEEFKHLREMDKYLESICPSNSDSLTLIENMLQQVISFHQSIAPLKYFHIGCDEVYHMNKCDQCLKRRQSDTSIYLNHVNAIADIVKGMSPATRVLIWDDMLRQVPLYEWEAIKNLEIEPVYWNYKSNLKVSHISLIKYYDRFKNIWIASAFKGADGVNATFPNLKKRFLNNLNWMRIIHNYKFGGESDVYSFKGIILTGWSRYGHLYPPCELLPVSIPSLFLNLILIKKFKNGGNWTPGDDLKDFFDKNFNDDLTANLHCSTDINIDHFDPHKCYFDGNNLYQILKYCEMYSHNIVATFKDIPKIKSYINWYHNTHEGLTALESKMVKILTQYYDKYVIEQYLSYKLGSVKEMLN